MNEEQRLRQAIAKREAALAANELNERRLIANPNIKLPPGALLRLMEDKAHLQKALDELRNELALRYKQPRQQPAVKSARAEPSKEESSTLRRLTPKVKINPDVAKRRAIVANNPERSAHDLCGLFDLDRVPIPEKWPEQFTVDDWRGAYKNKACRARLHALISIDRRHS
jgi:hypothetical protein